MSIKNTVGWPLKLGLDAIYQHPNTSKPNSEHQVYPYSLSQRLRVFDGGDRLVQSLCPRLVAIYHA